jgi:hypothetical protein
MGVCMYRGTAAAAVVTLALAGLLGCGSVARGEAATSALRTTTSVAAADGSGVRACFDGTCEIAVSKPTNIPVDSRFGISKLSITRITPDSVSMTATGPGISMAAQTGPGGICSLNGLTVRVKAIAHGTAVLVLSPNR